MALVAFQRNVVATVDLETRLDLKNIALHARNAEYNPKVGSACVLGPSFPFLDWFAWFSGPFIERAFRFPLKSVSRLSLCASETPKQRL